MRQTKGLFHAVIGDIAKRMAMGLAALFISQAAEAVFFTPGQIAVSPTGAANYSIPIALPPGTGGMVPSLAINYNSQGGNGLLGVGWNLSGLSAITRCPKTVVQDGVRSPVQYTAADKYCLDGQRLVAVVGVYGANGTEYRTERESFSKITSWGSSGSPASGPAIFKVWTKSGLLMEYGNSTDSLIVQQGKTNAQVWALNKVIDTKGNYYTITYQDNSATNGEFYPVRIDYTGNAVAGLMPYSSVRFSYAARSDKPILYDRTGSKIQSTVVLTNIQTYTKVSNIDTLVKNYILAYQAAPSPATKRTRLASITECAGDGTCLPATTIAWDAAGDAVGNAAATLVNAAAWYVGSNGFSQRQLGDFDGNGKTDLLAEWSDNPSAAMKCTGLSSAATYSCAGMTLPSGTGGKVVVADFNADGYSDTYNGSSYCKGPSLTSCTSVGPAGNLVTLPGGATVRTPVTGVRALELNGDGYPDVSYFQIISTTDINGVVTYGYRRGYCLGPLLSSCVESPTVIYDIDPTVFSEDGPYAKEVSVGDFNGDGVSEMIYLRPKAGGLGVAGYDVYYCSGTAIGQADTATTGCRVLSHMKWESGVLTTLRPYSHYSGDFNGDGISDIYLLSPADSKFCPGPGLLTANNCVQAVSGDWQSPFTTLPGDYNGDGVTDLLLVGLYASYFCAGPGISTSNNCVSKVAGNWKTTYDIRPGDFDGDGTTDLLLISIYDPYDYYRYFVETGAGRSDLVSTITNGIGAAITFSYKPLTDASVYTKGTGSVYPVVDVQAPMYVVSNVASSDGIGGVANTSYTYFYARAHQKGGGFLGFEYVRSCDTMVTPNVCNQTRYTQDYPHQGLASTVLKFVKNATTTPYLNLVSNTWSYGTNAAWGAAYHVPQLSQSQEISYELAGSGAVQGGATTNVVTANTYDLYGNPTVITVTSAGGFSKTTTNTYVNDPVNWFLGRLTGAIVTSTAP